MQINFLTKAPAIVPTWWFGSGIAREYLLKLSWIVSMYLFCSEIIGNFPTKPINIFLNALPGISVIIIRFFVVSLASFLIWHCKQSCIWVISWEIYSQHFFCLLTSKIIDTFFFSMWCLKISRYNFFKFGTRENFLFLTAHWKLFV